MFISPLFLTVVNSEGQEVSKLFSAAPPLRPPYGGRCGIVADPRCEDAKDAHLLFSGNRSASCQQQTCFMFWDLERL